VEARPNLNGAARFWYALAGYALIAVGFALMEPDSTWFYILPILGGVVAIEGMIGFSVVLAVLGGKRET
jgi:hypothetical protein